MNSKELEGAAALSADNSQDAGDEETFIVEKILNRRIRTGKVQYLIKWKGFSKKHNSWEPVDNLFCQDLIQRYEAETTKGKKQTASKKKRPEAPSGAMRSPTKINGFDKGLEVQEIVGAAYDHGYLYFEIMFKGADTTDIVPNYVANSKIPELIIRFYESRLDFFELESNKIAMSF